MRTNEVVECAAARAWRAERSSDGNGSQAIEVTSEADMDARFTNIAANPSLGRLILVAALLSLAVGAPVQGAGRHGDEVDGAIARVPASLLTLDFDPRDGATVVGLTSSAPLMNHTVYETDASTIVLEIPDADVSRLEPQATIGTPQVAEVRVSSVTHGSATTARIEIKRSLGARRSVAVDPKNPNRIEITVESAASPAAQPRVASVPTELPRVLASATAPRPEIQAAVEPEAAQRRAPASTFSPVASSSDAPIVPKPIVETVLVKPRLPESSRLAKAATSTRAQPAAGTVAPAAVRGPGKLVDLSVEEAGDGRTLVRLTSTRPLDARPFVLDNAPRLVIDLEDTINDLPFANLPVRGSSVVKIRAAQHAPLPNPVTRLVIEWTSEQPYELIPGPDAMLVAIGSAGGSDYRPPAMAQAGAPSSWNPAMAQPVAMTSATGASSFANLGRPATSTGAPPPPLVTGPAGSRLRETAETGQFVAPAGAATSARFDEVRVTGEDTIYTGEPISISVKDADLQDLFRLFHEVSGLNIVVDPSVKGKTITLELVEVPWDQAMDLVLRTQGLGQSLEGNVLRIAPMQKLAQEEQQAKQLKEAQELSGEVTQVAFPLSYAQGAQAETIIRKSLSQRGDVTTDRRTNTLIIKDLPERIEDIKALLQLVDQPTKQVSVEARIVETTLDFSKSVGLVWGFSYIADRAFGNSTGFSFPRSIGTDYAVNLPVQAASSVLGLSFRNILNTFALDLQISALEDRGKARIISRPMVMVANNESAEIESGVQIPISNTTATEIEVTFVSASLKLTVTPQITADNTVIMNLKVENNAPVFIQTAGDNASISTRQAKTVVAVPDGGTTVIGGIYQVNEGAASTRVPFLSRIPLLGWLFRNKTINRTNDELLIFVTPRIQKA